jgi:hypothetical protein
MKTEPMAIARNSAQRLECASPALDEVRIALEAAVDADDEDACIA